MYQSTPRHIADMDIQHRRQNLELRMVWNLYLKNVPLGSAGVWEFVYQSVRTANNFCLFLTFHPQTVTSRIARYSATFFFTFCWPCILVYLSQYLANLMHHILFHNKFHFMPLHVSSTCAHHQEVKIALHSLWYHHTYSCDDTRGMKWNLLWNKIWCIKLAKYWDKFSYCCAVVDRQPLWH